ncbi:N-acetylneuraminate synthase family protein [Helicovermis profundi]|uniref:N-acetylneuraminate synthase family protein n=1 Tax=Helicovermis profundi TaxID=3065157 RepID=A0AAU9E673_9FIRM|nr:N-acetylneuraminate synthase family protein [Clostridia bacterium S502]
MKIKIGRNYLGSDEKPYFIADIAANHDGDIERAYKLIELAKKSGADAAKFQNFNAVTIVSKKGFDSFGKKLSHQESWKKSVYEVYEDASIDSSWTKLLKKKCDEVGIEYMTSPYDFESVDLADPYVNAYKIGSGDITWTEIIRYMAKKTKPIILSTGASTEEDVERAVDIITKENSELILMQCNTNYRGVKENFNYINLNVLNNYKKKYPNVILGLSDHTHGYETVIASIALGARVIEKHFTDDNNREGPDHKFSMTPNNFSEMVEKSLNVYNALGDGIKKVEKNEKEAAIVQRRALYFVRDIKAGEIISKNDLFPLRPIKEDGIAPYEIINVIGKKIIKDCAKDDYLRWKDLDGYENR